MIVEEGEFDPREVPEALDRVLGKTLAFRLKVIPGNKRYSVSQLSGDATLVNSIFAKLLTCHLKDEPELSTSSVQLTDDGLDSQTFSVTAESDGNLMDSITPAKRNSVASDTDFNYLQLGFRNISRLSD